MESLISVVIPAFNAEKTISKCIKSILNQSYSNLDIIVVNDGSTDNTEKITKKIISEDKRVRLFTIKNQGVSHARNFGIDHAEGDFITFVDSDDYIDQEMYEMLLRLMEKHKVKIAHCSYKSVLETGETLSIVGNHGRIVEQNHDDALRCIIEGKLFIGGLCNKLYSYDLFQSHRLDESIKINEDILLNFQLFSQVEKSVYCDYPYYNYLNHQGSSTHVTSYVQKSEEAVYVSKRILELSKGHPYQLSAEKRVAMSLLGLYGSYISDKNKDNSLKRKEVVKELKEYKNRGLISSKKDLIRFNLYRFIPDLYLMGYSIYDKFRVKKLDPEQVIS